ncbi:MAG TPA: hypothetical protein VJU59_38190 [Paraburkholderia sp.]|uniref:hypothetical protein n=1 Tax=Paraburkholderia sp. TaxID=1926495 RepID=UPI002B4A6575|nr:hypothetical protein [Paraburkholderia sp.]HKR45440.1 hypothetical protein [Paraburkholderia sp.]
MNRSIARQFVAAKRTTKEVLFICRTVWMRVNRLAIHYVEAALPFIADARELLWKSF